MTTHPFIPGFRAYDGNHAPKPPFVLNRDSEQAEGLIRWWPGIVGPSGNLLEMTGNGFDATPIANALFERTAFDNQAPATPGINQGDGWDVGEDLFNILNATKFTLSLYFQRDVAQADAVPWAVMGNRSTAGSDWQMIDGLSPFHPQRWVNYNGGGGPINDVGSSTLVGSPAHIAVSLEDAVNGSLNFYQNGLPSGTPDVNPGTMGQATSTNWGIGIRRGQDDSDFNAKIWDIRVYDHIRSPAAIYPIWNPETRWELWGNPTPRTYYLPSVAVGISVNIGIAVEADTAPAIVPNRDIVIGLASETDTAFVLTHSKAVDVIITTELDTALPITIDKSVDVGLAVETDTAFAVIPGLAITIGLSAEADSAFPIAHSKAVNVGLASEADSALSLIANKDIPVGLATETDTALAVVHAKSVQVGIAIETDTAFAMTITGGIFLTPSAYRPTMRPRRRR